MPAMGVSRMVKTVYIIYPVYNENKINLAKMKEYSQGTFSVLASFLFSASSLPLGF